MSARLGDESVGGDACCTRSVVGGYVSVASLSAADWVCLGATPVFALMALLTALGAFEMPHMHGAMTHGGSALGGMAFMYLLMSAFHAAPWLRRFSAARRASGAAYRGVFTGSSM